MAQGLIDRTSNRRLGSERRSTVAAGVIVVGCVFAAIVAIVVALMQLSVNVTMPAPATTILVLTGFVLFFGARRRVV